MAYQAIKKVLPILNPMTLGVDLGQTKTVTLSSGIRIQRPRRPLAIGSESSASLGSKKAQELALSTSLEAALRTPREAADAAKSSRSKS
jgi:hypothetical protein